MPDQPPEAVQVVALVLDQVRVVVPPLLVLVGLAVSATVGAGVDDDTVTVAELLALPPPPVQVSEKVLVALSAGLA